MPLLLARELARHPHRAGRPSIVSETLTRVIRRADELGEFVSLYWKDGRQPLSAQVKKGLAKVFNTFDEYQLGKYNRDEKVKLRDVAFLAHVRPTEDGQVELKERKYKNGTVKILKRTLGSKLNKLVTGTLATPDTWEVGLSAGKDKAETFRRLLAEGKLGGLAFLRNLRNMMEAGISKTELIQLAQNVRFNRVLPFRFIAAAKVVGQLEDLIEPLMLQATADLPRLTGKTAVLVDVSGSMNSTMSGKSDLWRVDAAIGLAILAREVCEEVVIAGFESIVHPVRPRRGFALRDELNKYGGGTDIDAAVAWANSQNADRLILITDEQSHTRVRKPTAKFAYLINVAAYKNGVGYGDGWTAHIDGFSENVLRYIVEAEKQ
jgi:hypothetical protein